MEQCSKACFGCDKGLELGCSVDVEARTWASLEVGGFGLVAVVRGWLGAGMRLWVRL